MENRPTMPAKATNAEKWIIHVLFATGKIKMTAKVCNVTIRRVQQVVQKYNIELVNC